MTTQQRKVSNQEIYQELISIREYLARQEHHFETLKKLEERVNGNGKPGLVQEMALVQEREVKRDRREWFLTTVIVVQAIALISSILF